MGPAPSQLPGEGTPCLSTNGRCRKEGRNRFPMTDVARSKSINLLLACMDPTGRAWKRAVRENAIDADWAWILERARAHKLIGMIATRSSEAGLDEMLPDSVRAELVMEREKGIAHGVAVSRTLAEVRGLLGGLDCPFFVVKGSVYAHEIYGNPAMRRFSDIDIVIPHERLDDVDHALKKAGYYFWAPSEIHQNLPRWFRARAPDGEEPGSEAAARRILAAFHRHHLYVLKKEDPRMHVEAHWHVFLPTEGRASSQDIWSRTRVATLEGVETLTLDYEASLLHGAVHAMEQPPTEYRLLHLCDVAWMLWKWKDVIDPEKLRDLAREWGLSAWLTAAVMAAERVLPFGLPEACHRIWPERKSLRGGFLTGAGFGEWIVGQSVPEGRFGRLAESAQREALWELALGRPPAFAWGRVRRAFQVRIRGVGARGRASTEVTE